MDKETADILMQLSEEWRIDATPRDWKYSNASHLGLSKDLWSFITMQHRKTYRNTEELGHEAWHAIEFIYSHKEQNSLNAMSSRFCSEVESYFFQFLMSETHMKKAKERDDNEEVLELKMRMLDNAVSATFRQMALYDFEMNLHKEHKKKWYVWAERIDEIFEESIQPTLWKAFEKSSPYKKDWVVHRHARLWFISARYVPGFLLAHYIFTRVKKDPSFYQVFKENFLKVWSSKSPKEIFQSMWIDITSKDFWLACYKNIDDIFKEIETDAKKLGVV